MSTYDGLQYEGHDYEETFSTIVNFLLIHLFIITFACILAWAHSYSDIKSAYLHRDMDQETYIKQPEFYVIPVKGNFVLKLIKTIWVSTKPVIAGTSHLEVEGTTCVCTHKHVYTDLPIFTET